MTWKVILKVPGKGLTDLNTVLICFFQYLRMLLGTFSHQVMKTNCLTQKNVELIPYRYRNSCIQNVEVVFLEADFGIRY